MKDLRTVPVHVAFLYMSVIEHQVCDGEARWPRVTLFRRDGILVDKRRDRYFIAGRSGW